MSSSESLPPLLHEDEHPEPNPTNPLEDRVPDGIDRSTRPLAEEPRAEPRSMQDQRLNPPPSAPRHIEELVADNRRFVEDISRELDSRPHLERGGSQSSDISTEARAWMEEQEAAYARRKALAESTLAALEHALSDLEASPGSGGETDPGALGNISELGAWLGLDIRTRAEAEWVRDRFASSATWREDLVRLGIAVLAKEERPEPKEGI